MHKNKLVITAVIIFLIAAVLISQHLISNDTNQLTKSSTELSHRSTPEASVHQIAEAAALDAQDDVIDEYGPPKWYLSVTTTELMLRVTANPYREFEALEYALANSPDNLLLNALYFDICAITLPAPHYCNLPMSDAFVQEAKQYRSLSKIYARWLYQQARHDEVLLLLNAMQHLPLSDSWLADKKVGVLRQSLSYGVELYDDVLLSYVKRRSDIGAANHLQVCNNGYDDDRYNTICHQLASQYEFPTIEYFIAQQIKIQIDAKNGILTKEELTKANIELLMLQETEGPYAEYNQYIFSVFTDDRVTQALVAMNGQGLGNLPPVLLTYEESKNVTDLIESGDYVSASAELLELSLDRNGY